MQVGLELGTYALNDSPYGRGGVGTRTRTA